jgi:hypothetical protein
MGNETVIQWWKAPTEGKQEFFRRLDNHNRDVHWKNRTDVNISRSLIFQYKRTLALAITGKLGLSSFLKQKVLRNLLQIDLQRLGMRTEVVAFCLAAQVLNDEVNDRYGKDAVYHPQRNSENNDERFAKLHAELIDSAGIVSESYIQSAYAKLNQGDPDTRPESNWKHLLEEDSVDDRNPQYQPIPWSESRSTPPI